jgi:P4 family phage/plasmid primase-like protien
MIICIRTFEYNIYYDKWEHSLELLKDLLRDCYQDIGQRISTCCNIYTYHGHDLTYIDFYNILDDPKMLTIIKKRSINYSDEYNIVDSIKLDGQLVLVQDEEEESDNDENVETQLVEKVEQLTITKFEGEVTDNDISDYLLSTMENNIMYYEPEDKIYAYEEDKGWTKYSKEKLHAVISKNIPCFFSDPYIISLLGSFNKRSNIITDMYLKIKSFHSVNEINKWNLIGFKNGIYDNNVGTFLPFSSFLHVTLSTQVSYVFTMNEEDDLLLSILEKIFPNPAVFVTVMRWFGYLLVSGNPEKYVTIWHGSTGNNGKSWIQRLIREAFGDYYATLPISLLTGKRSNSSNPTPELSCLENCLAVMLQEPDTTERMNGGRVKELTGNDSMYIRELYKSPRSIRIRAKVVVVANNRIETVGLDSAIRRRFFVIPFESTFVTARELEQRQSKNVNTTNYYIRRNIDHLSKELAPAFIRIAINQHQLYMKHGMEISDDFYKYTTDFIMANNKILRFIHRYLEQDVGERLLISTAYESFKTWYRELYPSMRPPDHDAFLDELDKESIKMVEDRYIDDYRCTYVF